MRTFLLRLLAFALLFVAGYAAILFGVVLLNVRATGQCRVGQDVDSVIVGDSHGMWSIDDSTIPGLRNISLNAEGYRYTYGKLEQLFASEPHVRRVYLSVGFHNFAGYYDQYIDGSDFKFFAARYLGILTWRDYVAVAKKDLADFPSFIKRLVTGGFRPGLKGQCELYGTFPTEKQTQSFDLESTKKRVESQFFASGKLLPESASNVTYLQKIVELCREKNVELVVLNTPLHQEYERRIPESYKKRLVDFIASNHLDYYHFDDLALDDASFLPDGDHLNSRGAELTTAKFAEYHRAHPAKVSPLAGQ